MEDKKLRQRLFGENYKSLNLWKGQGLIARTIERERSRIVKCEKCKCLIFKEDAIKGKDEIRKTFLSLKKYIYTPYYCHRCVPKKLKKK